MKSLARQCMACILLLVLLLWVTTSVQAGAFPLAVIHNPKEPHQVNLRAGAGTSTKSLGLYYSGTEVVVYDTEDEWCKVEIYGREGYIQKKYLMDAGSQGQERMPVGFFEARPYGVVNNPNPADRLNLRGRPTESWDTYGKCYNGTEVQIMGEHDGWYHVLTENGSGFVMAKFINKGQRSATGSIGNAIGTAAVSNPNPADRLHLRKEAKPDGVSVGKYYSGVVVDVLNYENDTWSLVRIGDVVGFMRKEFLVYGAESSQVASAIPTMTVTASGKGTAIRETPNEKAPELGTCPEGTAVQILGIVEGGWYHACVGDQVGYMQAKHLK